LAELTRLQRRDNPRTLRRAAISACAIAVIGACDAAPRSVAPVLSPRRALRTFRLPPGYRIELVAAEPLVRDPVAIDFDPDGRMYVVEMSGYMPSITGEGEDRPIGRIVVLEDRNDDGRMDTRTVFLDSLVLPRTVAVLSRGVLVGAPPFLWLARDTTGDLRADTREMVRDDYGRADANPEHNANGALWGVDNWIHSANHTVELRLRADGTFDSRTTPSLGQWGVSSDEYGRLYRNSNEDPLRADMIPAHYATRDGGTATIRGVYAALTPNVPVFPSRKTPAVNRGYRERTLRPDSTLAHYTSAGSATAFVGDRLPPELRRSVFVAEPAGNLVGQFTVSAEPGGAVSAMRAVDSTDFLTSTDERFRPVYLSNAPDGTLYIVDMHRGIIQHRTFITDYLEEKIRDRGLEQPIGYGRIYRVVHRSFRRGPRPGLSARSPAELVDVLTHPNGWWRITAQRLLVERSDRSAAPALRALQRHQDDRVRLHALWTLEGVGEIDSAVIATALADASPHVRTAGVRVAEPHMERGHVVLRAAVVAMVSDSSAAVRRQVLASIGALPSSERYEVLATVAGEALTDDITAELFARAAGLRAEDLLARVLASSLGDGGRVASEALAAAIARQRDRAAVDRTLLLASDATRPTALRLALLRGLIRGAGQGSAFVELRTRPAGLLAMSRGDDSTLAAAATRLAAALDWPGKPRPAANAVRALTPGEVARVAAGRDIFGRICQACHQADGLGAPNIAASLVRSAYVNGTPLRLIRILLQGKEGMALMPPVGATLSDEEVAAVLSYVRREWGNTADPIDAAQVREIRGVTTGRRRPWTDAELAAVNR
jgi:mono/diheme cytochrome c family protein/glucose/arabinose dehydrogenase